MPYTKEQELAINEGGKNIIVSAGAGSGKTQVLTQRILRHVKEGIDIRKLLILTFTKAAAKEMKERVIGLLKKNDLKEALHHIDSAYITTFDSFSLSVVKKYGYHLQLEKDIRVADGGILLGIKCEIIERIFNQLYEEENESFFTLLQKYTVKDDRPIRELLLNIMENVELIPNENTFFSTTKAYYSNEHLNNLKHAIENFCREEFDIIVKLADSVKELCLENNVKLVEALQFFIDSALQSTTYCQMRNLVSEFELPRLGKNSDAALKEAKDLLSKQTKKFLQTFFYETLDEATNEYCLSQSDAMFVFDLVKRINDELVIFKKENMYYSFSDIAKMAITLVRDFKEVQEELKNQYYEILIDEYQDTSDLQETFINYISKSNVYMVGDIKQSIYRFRNANPYIFKEKYNKYRSSPVDLKIDLTKNFRSRKEVISDFNLIFNEAMKEKQGDADYSNDHQMIFGQTDYESKGAVSYDTHMEIRRFMIPEEFDEDGKVIKPPKVDNSLAQMVYIAKDILKKKKTYSVLSKDDGFRNIMWKDFCILISSSTKFQQFKQLLQYFNIPTIIDANLDLKKSLVAVPLCNLLKVILYTKYKQYDNYYKHALASALRSFIFNYTDDKIFDIIHNKVKDPLFLEFHKLADESSNYSIIDFVDLVLTRFKVYQQIVSIGNILEANVEIERVKTILSDYVSLGYNEIEAITNTIEVLKGDNKIEYKNFIDPNADMVRIMTIHKSKGLEFPVCYFPFLDSKFNIEETKQTLGFDIEYGMFLPKVDGKLENKTIIKDLVVHRIRKEEISERVRVFYVALTRAREKMVMTYKGNNSMAVSNPGCFRDLLTMANVDSFCFDTDPRDYQIGREYSFSRSAEINGGSKTIQDIGISYEKEKLRTSHASKKIQSVLDLKTRQSIDLGLKLHAYLESLDFHNLDIETIEDKFVQEKLKSLFHLPLFATIKEARVYQEYEFIWQSQGQRIHGIIDLLLLYEDKAVIIDYKLSQTKKTEYVKQLRVYKGFLETKVDVPIKTYLVSLLKCEALEVEV